MSARPPAAARAVPGVGAPLLPRAGPSGKVAESDLLGFTAVPCRRNWRPEQPDDWYGHGLGGGEDCAHFTADGRWNDDVCRRPYRWVCEAELGRAS